MGPVLIVLIALAASRHWQSEPAGVDPEHYALTYFHVKGLLSHWLVKVCVFGAICLPLFHCMHRIRHTFEEFGLGAYKTLLAGTFYLTAIVGTVLCAVALIQI